MAARCCASRGNGATTPSLMSARSKSPKSDVAIGPHACVRDNNLRDCIRKVPCRAHRAANWNTNTIEYYSGVLAPPLASPLVSPLREMVLPASLLGLALGLVAVTRRFLCTIGSAFRHPIPFRNPRRLVKRFVSAPFHFAARQGLSLSER